MRRQEEIPPDPIPEDIVDIEAMVSDVEGLSIRQIRLLRKFYQFKTGDMDLEALEEVTQHI